MPTADIAALIAAFCWSCANIAIARGSGGRGGDNGAFLSILITSAFAAVVWVAEASRRGWVVPTWAAIFWFALAGALTIFIGRVFFHSSIQWLGAVRGSSVKRLAPLFAVLLGVLMLGDPLTGPLVLGAGLIFAGFGVLVHESLSSSAAAARAGAGGQAADAGGMRAWRAWVNPGLFFGAVSSLAYAAGNIARKYGLHDMPDPAFGAMLGSLVGAILYVVTAAFVDEYRTAVRNAFTRFNPWLLGAGVLASAGQLLFFVAIDLGTVSRAALIVSSEVFVTMAITYLLFRKREPLTRAAVAAAVLGFAGTVVIMADAPAGNAPPAAAASPRP